MTAASPPTACKAAAIAFAGGIDDFVRRADKCPHRHIFQLCRCALYADNAAGQRRDTRKKRGKRRRYAPCSRPAHAVSGQGYIAFVDAVWCHRHLDQAAHRLCGIAPSRRFGGQLRDQNTRPHISQYTSLQLFRKAVCRRDKVEIVPFAAAAVQIDNKRHPRARLGRDIQIIPPCGVSHRRTARAKCCCCGFCRSRCGGRCCRHCSDGKCGFPAVVCVCRTAVVCRSVVAAVAAAFSVFADAEAAGKAVSPCVCKGCDIMTEVLSACFTEPHPHIPTTHRFATIRYKAHLFTAKPFHRRYTNVLAFFANEKRESKRSPASVCQKTCFLTHCETV